MSKNYFSGETKILNPENSFKAINQFTIGDYVTTFNQSTGKFENVKITSIYKSRSKDWYNLRIGNSSTLATPDYLYVNENMNLVKVKDLKPGDKLWVVRSPNKKTKYIDKLELNYSLGYVLGALLIGEGNIWGSSIVFQTTNELISFNFKNYFTDCFGLEPNKSMLLKSNKGVITPIHQININNVQIASIINELCDNNVKKNSFKIPRIIFNDYSIFKGFYNACLDSNLNNVIKTQNKLFVDELANLFNKECSSDSNGYSIDIREDETILNKIFNDNKNENPIIIYPDIKLEKVKSSNYEKHTDREGLGKLCYALELENCNKYIANSVYICNSEV